MAQRDCRPSRPSYTMLKTAGYCPHGPQLSISAQAERGPMLLDATNPEVRLAAFLTDRMCMIPTPCAIVEC